MIMRLVKTAALVWVANKVREKVFGRKPGPQSTVPARRTAKA
jgi:hypothetical protein